MRSSRLVGLAVVVAALGAPLAGCAAGGLGGAATAPQPITARPAPSIDVPLLNGPGRLRNADLRGRPTLLNFWASWCYPCRQEMPDLVAFAKAHPGIRVVGIATDDTASAARAFARKVGVRYELALDAHGDLLDRFGAPGTPTTYVLDSRGRIARVHAGQTDERGFAALAAGVT